MRRRALLVALCATGAGCLRGLSGSDRGPTFRVHDLASSSTTVAPEKRYVVAVTAAASRAALADDPATVAFSLTNVGDHVLKVSSGTVPPFGVLWAEGGGRRVLLWRDYEEGCVTFSEDGIGVCAIGKLTPTEPGRTVRREYDLRRSAKTSRPATTSSPTP